MSSRPGLLASFRRAGDDLLSVLLPPVCSACGELRTTDQSVGGICSHCWSSVEYLTGPCCPSCGRPHPSMEDDDLEGLLCGACLASPPPFDRGLSMGFYRGTLRSVIRLLKFSRRPDLALPLAARARVCLREAGAGLGGVDLLIPVPLPPLRRLRRGYNQAAELARALGQRTGIPVSERALSRGGRGRPQAALSSARRAANVRGAFRLRRPPPLAGRSVLLVDDVWTTGATLRECSRVLRTGGARRITVFSLARALTWDGDQG